MPIDLAAVAARLTALAATDRLANPLARAVQAALERRAATVRAAEAASRDLPVLHVEAGALMVRVAAAGPAVAGGGPDPLAALRTAARTGWDRWLTAARDLPTFLAETDRLLGAVDESIARFAQPRPDLFDPRGRSVFDLAGAGAAAFSALSTAVADRSFDRFLLRVAMAVIVVRPPAPAPPSAPGGPPAVPGAPPAAPPAVSGAAAPPADEGDALVLAAAVAFTSAPRLLATLLDGVDLALRLQAVDLLAAVERRTRSAIAKVYRKVFDRLRSAGLRVLQLVRGVQVVVDRWAHAATSFALGLGGALGRAVRDFAYQLARFLASVVILVQLAVELLRRLDPLTWFEEERPRAPRLAFPAVPQFATTLFGQAVRDQFDATLTAMDEAARSSLRAGLDRTAQGLDATAARFGRLVDVKTGPFAFPPQLAADADALAARLLPAGPEPAGRDPLAAEIEAMVAQQWIAAGAVGGAAAVLDGFAREVAQQWHLRGGKPAPGTPTPTSPHILRRRATPVHVRVPRMLVRVGAPTGDDTFRAAAAEIAGAVRDAYRRGAPSAAPPSGGGR